jgi:subtilase family serine protease
MGGIIAMKSLSLLPAAALLWCNTAFAQNRALQAREPAGRQVLEGHLSPEMARAPLVGKLDDTTQLHLAIGLPLRNRSQLDAELKEVYDPKSSQFRHFLTPDEFARRFGAGEEDYRALTTFARRHGFTVTNTFSDRLLLAVTGTAAVANKAFHLQMVMRKRLDGSIFFAPDREPSIDLDTKVLHISGLDNYIRVEHAFTGSGPGGGFGGSDFRNAYAPGVSQTGTGQSVGLFEMQGFYTADISGYKNQFQKEEPTIMNVPVTVIIADDFVASATQSGPPQGGCNAKTPLPPNTPPAGTPTDTLEVSLDIEVAMAMAPGLDNIYAYEGCNQDAILEKMTDNLPDGSLPPNQLSASYTWGSTDQSTINAVSKMAMDGQTLFVTAGDFHLTCPDGNESSSLALPYVTVVGGTILQMIGKGQAWQSETAANDGGGFLKGVKIPDYQAQAVTSVGGSPVGNWRMIPDVAMTSCDGSRGPTRCGALVVYGRKEIHSSATGETDSHVTGERDSHVTGTSVAAPLWAGYIALANEQRGYGSLGFLNPTLYAIYSENPTEYALDFHDIVSGSTSRNPKCQTVKAYSAGVGYDFVTGLGSPTAHLISDLSAPPNGPPQPPACNQSQVFCERLKTCVAVGACPTVVPTHPQ